MRRPQPLALGGALGTLVALVATSCGAGGGSMTADSLGLPTAPPTTLASTRVNTSPDGGIYQNPDHLEVTMLAGADATPVERSLGASASGWSDLQRLGSFTVIGLRLRNDGKSASEPALNDLQVASDFAPASTSSGPLRHFYHPTFPLAALSPEPVTGDCTIHLDPGQTASVLLLYPPLQQAPTLLWGRYREFALQLRRGGGAAGLGGQDLHVRHCTPPPAPSG